MFFSNVESYLSFIFNVVMYFLSQIKKFIELKTNK